MEEIMQSNTFFIVPLTLAYLVICSLWFIVNRKTGWWVTSSVATTDTPGKDLIVGLAAAAGIFGTGQLYSAGLLIPEYSHALTNRGIWVLNNLIIFSPIFIAMAIRKQPLTSVLISTKGATVKLAFGAVASLIGITLFLGLRNEWGRVPEVLTNAIKVESLSYFPAIFLENVAVAFLFVRLKWLIGIRWAILVPSLLFALAHVPGSLAEGDPWSHILTFFFLTGSLTIVILYTAYRSRDILWLGLVHYMMDIAIKAF